MDSASLSDDDILFAFEEDDADDGDAFDEDSDGAVHEISSGNELGAFLSQKPDASRLFKLLNTSIGALPDSQISAAGASKMKEGLKRLVAILAGAGPKGDDMERAQHEEATAQEEVKSLESQVSLLAAQRDQLLQAQKAENRRNKDEMQKLEALNSNLKEEKQNLENQVLLQKNYVHSLEEQIADANDEKANVLAQVKELSAKLDAKSMKLQTQKEEKKQIENLLRETQLELCQCDLKLTSQQFSKQTKEDDAKLAAENKRLSETIAQLNKISDEQTFEIVSMMEKSNTMEAEIEKLNESSFADKKKIKELQDALDEMKKKEEKLNANNAKANEEIEELHHNIASLQTDYDESQKVIQVIQSAAEDAGYSSIEDTIEFIKQLPNTKNDEKLKEENYRLRALIDVLVRFFVGQDEMDGNIILSNSIPILKDDNVRNELQKRINETRKTTHSNPDGNVVFEQFFGNENLENKTIDAIIKRNAQDEYSAVIVLAQINESLRLEIKRMLSTLGPLINILPNDVTNDDACQEITNYFMSIVNILEDLALTTKTVFEPKKDNSALHLIENYINESASILISIQTDIKEITKFDGPITTLADYICNYISALQKELKEAREATNTIESKLNKSMQELQNSLNKSQDIVGTHSKQYEKQIRSLTSEIEKLKQENLGLNQRADISVDKLHQLENTIKQMRQKAEDQEIELSGSQQEVARLRASINDKADQYQKRFEEIVLLEQSHHADEVKRVEKKKNEQILALEEQIRIKAKKLEQAKKMNKDNNEIMQKSLISQRESMKKLMQQNQELSQRIVDAGEYSILREKVKDMEQKLLEANCAKHQLTLQLNRITSQKTEQSEAKVCEQIGQKLEEKECKKPECGWTSDGILAVFSSLMDNNKQLQKEASIVPSEITLSKAEEQWFKWAYDMLSIIDSKMDPKRMGENAIRNAISDCIIMNTRKTKTVELLQSLRFQKRILTSFSDTKGKPEDLSFESLTYAVSFIEIVKHRISLKATKKILGELNDNAKAQKI